MDDTDCLHLLLKEEEDGPWAFERALLLALLSLARSLGDQQCSLVGSKLASKGLGSWSHLQGLLQRARQGPGACISRAPQICLRLSLNLVRLNTVRASSHHTSDSHLWNLTAHSRFSKVSLLERDRVLP